MKAKKLLLCLIMPLLSIFIFTGCKSDSLEKISKNLSTYNMEIIYNDDHTINVKQTLNYKNNTDTSLDNLKLHLYPNCFREGSTCTVVSTLNYNKCYYNGVSYGSINIEKLSVEDEEKEIILEEDNDILNVNFSSSLSPNSIIEINMEYSVTIPNINHRFGYGENTINIANFYPIPCIYENGNFVVDSYHYNGDPFYSDMANYNVKITTPKDYILTSTGNILSEASDEQFKIYNISAEVVRDFAFVLSDKFNVVSDTYNNTTVNYYYYKNQYPSECLKAGTDAIRTFNETFGEYPYKVLNIVETNFVHGGMEYPNLVMISDAVDVQSDYINVIIHEIAHQWWYGIVGNNEYQYGWLDEGLTEYSTLLFYEKNPEYNVNTDELIKNTTNSFVTFVDVYKKVFDTVDTSMNRKLNEYNNESEYVYIAYVKGMLIFDSLREVVGDKNFFEGLKIYFDENKYGIVTPDNLINAFEKASGNTLREFFSSWIDGKVQIFAIN